MSVDPKEFGAWLRRCRVMNGVSLRELARRAEISPTYLSRIENGKGDGVPTIQRLEKLAKILGVSIDVMAAAGGKIPTDVALAFFDRPEMFGRLIRAAFKLSADRVRDLCKIAEGGAK